MENNFWKNAKDVLDDFELLSDLYDPNVEVQWNMMKNLPRCTRGRGTKIVDSDTDEDEIDYDLSLNSLNYNQEDLKAVDAVREYEVQDALRKACGIGHSNLAIESYWRARKDKETDIGGEKKEKNSNLFENTKQNVNSKLESNEENENVMKSSKVTNEGSNSHSNINNTVRRNGLSRRTTYERYRPKAEYQEHKILLDHDEDIAIHSTINKELSKISMKEETINDMHNYYGYYSDSSDENIVLDSRDLDDITNNTNDKKKVNRKKYRPVDIDIKLPTKNNSLINNEYAKIPTKSTSFIEVVNLQSVLNPNANEFISSFTKNNRDHCYKLASEKDFPPLS